jgi:hypothetical protein
MHNMLHCTDIQVEYTKMTCDSLVWMWKHVKTIPYRYHNNLALLCGRKRSGWLYIVAGALVWNSSTHLSGIHQKL